MPRYFHPTVSHTFSPCQLCRPPRFQPCPSLQGYQARSISTYHFRGVERLRQKRIGSRERTSPLFFDSPSFGDLSNSIHTIFQPQNFVDHTVHQSTLVSSLRLASRFLTTEVLLPFWYPLLCGPIETTTNPPTAMSPPATALSEYQKNEVVTKMELLASCVTFASERTRGRGDSGFTERLLSDAPPPFRGVKSHITISRRVFKSIEGSFSPTEQSNASRLWHQFLLVNLLLHELTHAAMYAAHPRPPAHDPIQAYFLPGARTTEEGMEWEASVFGGLLYEVPSFLFRDRRGGVFDSRIVLREWPSPRLVKNYRKSIYPRPFPIKGAMPQYDRVWLVSPRYFEQLFTTAFWDETVPAVGASALRPALHGPFISHGLLGLLERSQEYVKAGQ